MGVPVAARRSCARRVAVVAAVAVLLAAWPGVARAQLVSGAGEAS
jgi:hypothetical protein